MTRYIYLIASHINDTRRVDAFCRTLESIRKTKPDHVYVSFSTEDEFSSDIDSYITRWSDKLGDVRNNFYYQPEHKLQFEHYNILTSHVLDDDIVSFSDDDDLVHESKMEVIKKNLKSTSVHHAVAHKIAMFGCQLEYFDNERKDDIALKERLQEMSYREYVCYSIKGWLFKDWFVDHKKYTDLSFDESIKDKQCVMDCVLTTTLYNKENTLFISDVLYYYRQQGIKKTYYKKKRIKIDS
jgi:hypothetical protein